jgi:hypothetical protein
MAPPIRLIDKEDDEASAGGVLVGAVSGGRRGGARTLGRRQRHPLGADDAPRDPLDANAEVFRLKIHHRTAAAVDHRHVDRRHIDRGLKARQLRRLRQDSPGDQSQTDGQTRKRWRYKTAFTLHDHLSGTAR